MSLNTAQLEYLEAKGLSFKEAIELSRLGDIRKDPTAADRMARHRAKRKGDDVTRNVTGEPPNDNISNPPVPSLANANSVVKRATRIPADWKPEKPLPEPVSALLAEWPPGRAERELDGFRDYWTTRQRDACRADWDKVWWNRIRDQHDRIVRETRNVRGTAVVTLRGNRPNPSVELRRYAEAEESSSGCSETDSGSGGSLPAYLTNGP